MEHQVHPLFPGELLPVHLKPGPLGKFLLPPEGGGPVHRHPSGADQLGGLFPGPPAGIGQYLIQALHDAAPLFFLWLYLIIFPPHFP